MVSRSGDGSEGQRPLTPSRTPGTPMKPRLSRAGTSPSKREEKARDDKASKSSAKDVAELKDYVWIDTYEHGLYETRQILIRESTQQQLGDCLGKGAFGSVYRALNWNTGETVAVKQIKLVDLPKSELRVIMVRTQSLRQDLANTMCFSWKSTS